MNSTFSSPTSSLSKLHSEMFSKASSYAFALSLLSISCNAVTFSPLPTPPGLVDNGTFGPDVEVVHLFHDAGPIGITISQTGRAFATFVR